MSVLSLLHSLEANEWATIQEISERAHLPRRAVEGALEDLRLQGVPVIAGADGVRLSNDPEEVRQYALGRRRRLVSIAKGTRALLTAARRLDRSQPTLGL